MRRRVSLSPVLLVVVTTAACAPQVVQQPGPMLSKKVTTSAPVAAAQANTPPVSSMPSGPAYQTPGEGYVLTGATDTFIRWAHLPSRNRVGPNRVQIWTTQNYLVRPADGRVSERGLDEIDCRAQTYVMKAIATFPRYGAQGTPMESFNVPTYLQERHPIAPGTIMGDMMILACGA